LTTKKSQIAALGIFHSTYNLAQWQLLVQVLEGEKTTEHGISSRFHLGKGEDFAKQDGLS